jgi:divalent metal cation (Fe/Co/Zn/Cd) transporter
MALRITGTAFWLLSLSLIVTAGYSAYTSHKPETTIWGIVISLISIASMSVLMGLKMKTGRRLGSEAIIADARCTLICIYMSLVLLGSSLLFELTGLGWFDILGSAGLAWFSFSEGKECFEKARKDHHCSCH